MLNGFNDSLRRRGQMALNGSTLGIRPALLAVLAVLLFLAPVHSQDSSFDLDRRIEAAQEELRSLMSKRRYEEVIQQADALLEIDPGNASAVVWKAQARKLLAAPPAPEKSTISPSGLPIVGEGTVPTPVPREAPKYEPIPLAPQTATSSGGGIPLYILVGVIVFVAIVLIGVIVAIMKARASREHVREELEEAVREHTAHGEPRQDVHDAVTQVSGVAGAPTPPLDDDSVLQYGSVGKRDPETLSDRETLEERGTAEQKTEQLGAVNERDTVTEEDDEPSLSFTPLPTAPPSSGGNSDDGEDTIALDFGQADISAPEVRAPEVKAPDVSGSDPTADLTFGGLMFASEDETKKPAEGEKTKDAVSFDSLLFDQEQETAPPEKTPGDDPDAMSFNSLMFEGAEETRMPGQAPPADTRQAPPEEDDPNAMSFNSVMFEGDETVAPGQAKAGSSNAERDPLGETLPLTGGLSFGGEDPTADDPDATRALPPVVPPEGADQEHTVKLREDEDSNP